MRALMSAFRPMAGMALLALLALLSACASLSPAPELPTLHLPPAAFGASLSLAQRLTLTHLPSAADAATAAKPRSFDALLEIDPAGVRLAGFALGQRILTLSWDGKALRSEHPALLPVQVDAERVLRDVQLVYWPADSIRAVLPAGWTLADAGNQRCLYHDGMPAVRIAYEAVPRWRGSADLENVVEQYRLLIESHEQAE